MNIFNLFMEAGIVVKIVMLLLLAFSVVSWAIIFQKIKLIKTANKQVKAFEKQFWSANELNTLYADLNERKESVTGTGFIFLSGFKEFSKLYSLNASDSKTAMEGAERSMRLATNRELDSLDQNISVLGTIGSISPYIGLFGTVWGIMNAFFALGEAKQATLQMVAPHIGEALIATAIGLFAAIPAVIAYSRFSLGISQIEQSYYNFIDEFSSILQRQVASTGK